mmetsp:Transcript_27893/g.67572  ORF Transcript_27893/g.67572 Transcript_27893/m.67572 type:complete len:93 (-) Transcript_27893:211-489(-)
MNDIITNWELMMVVVFIMIPFDGIRDTVLLLDLMPEWKSKNKVKKVKYLYNSTIIYQTSQELESSNDNTSRNLILSQHPEAGGCKMTNMFLL